MAKQQKGDSGEYQDQGSLDQPEQVTADENGEQGGEENAEEREWTPEEPFDRVEDVPAGPTEGGPVNPVLGLRSEDEEEEPRVESVVDEQGGTTPAGTGTA